jgi:hypothetical protein
MASTISSTDTFRDRTKNTCDRHFHGACPAPHWHLRCLRFHTSAPYRAAIRFSRRPRWPGNSRDTYHPQLLPENITPPIHWDRPQVGAVAPCDGMVYVAVGVPTESCEICEILRGIRYVRQKVLTVFAKVTKIVKPSLARAF